VQEETVGELANPGSCGKTAIEVVVVVMVLVYLVS